MKNPTPWHIDPQASYLILDADDQPVYLGSQNAALIVTAVNTYVRAEQIAVPDGVWQTQEFNRHQEASIDGQCLTISQWLNRIQAIEAQWLHSGEGYVVLAKGDV